MRCTIWHRNLINIRRRFSRCGLNLNLENGALVGLQCCLQFHPQFGLSLMALDADPAFTLGEIELKRKQILHRLTVEGLLQPNKDLPVPLLPQNIGLITSKGSAACNDVLKTLHASGFPFHIYLADSIFQGGKTESSILLSLNILEKLKPDLVIIARGGGSKTDLFYLDNERIARRIARYPHPVWTGIGHEIDISVLDHVANRCFKTPTAVAEEIVARHVELKRHIDEAKHRLRVSWDYRFNMDRKWVDNARNGMVQGTRKLIDTSKGYLLGYATLLSSKVQERLNIDKSQIAVSKKMIAATSINLIQREKERLADRGGRFSSASIQQISSKKRDLSNGKKRFQMDRFMGRIRKEQTCLCDWAGRFMQKFNTEILIEKQKLAGKGATLKAMDPAANLKRGFALIYTTDGELVKTIAQIQPADKLTVEINDGRIVGTVDETQRR